MQLVMLYIQSFYEKKKIGHVNWKQSEFSARSIRAQLVGCVVACVSFLTKTETASVTSSILFFLLE